MPSVLEIDDAGRETLHEGMRLWELSRRLWPDQDVDTKVGHVRGDLRAARAAAQSGADDFGGVR